MREHYGFQCEQDKQQETRRITGAGKEDMFLGFTFLRLCAGQRRDLPSTLLLCRTLPEVVGCLAQGVWLVYRQSRVARRCPSSIQASASNVFEG